MADCEAANITNASTTLTIPTETLGFILTLKITVGTTCLLSILGASLIILTYVAFRDLRTTARQLLVNLSVADIIIAASHFVGLLTNYDRFLYSNLQKDTWCSVQAAITMYGTISSFLWTIAVALYMFTVIMMKRPEIAMKTVPVYYLVCWGIPVVFPVWFGVKDYLGFEQPADIGWCYLRFVTSFDVKNGSCNYTITDADRVHNIVAEMLGYDLWMYIAFIVLPLLYLSMHCYLRCKVAKKRHSSHSILSAVVRADLKLIFVPLIFLLLRIWSFVVDIPAFYLPGGTWEGFRNTWVTAILTLLSGIGVNGQGLANAILFCIFTKQVRQKLLKALKSLCCHCYNHSSQWHPMPSTTDHDEKHEETTVFEPTDHGGLTSTLEHSYTSLRQLDVPEGEQALLRDSAHFTETYGSSNPEKIV